MSHFAAIQKFKGQHIISALQLNHEEASQLLLLAHIVRYLDGALPGHENKPKDFEENNNNKNPLHCLQGKVLVPLFFENSTRTYSSFVSAMLKLCGGVCTLPLEASSISKGESFEDTIRCVDCYADFICLRHPDKEALARACAVSKNPILNCGNGVGEHPSQALLDLFCMTEELEGKTTYGKTIALIGDLKHGRTVHSLAKQLATFNKDGPKWKLFLVSPAALPMPEDVLEFLKKFSQDVGGENNNNNNNSSNLEIALVDALTPEIVKELDVMYVTRIQKERFAPAAQASYEDIKGSYVVNKELLKNAKSNMIVMHPLPRVDEISTDVDDDPRACYFKQMKRGLELRMALLLMISGKTAAFEEYAAKSKAGEF